MTTREQQQWREMVQKSFSPRDWFTEVDDNNIEDGYDTEVEDTIMWVYHQTEPNLWAVGYYSPDKLWHLDTEHETAQSAAARVHWLNGGQGGSSTVQEAARKGFRENR